MAILLTTVASGHGVNSTWELQRPEGVDTGVVVTYDDSTGQVTVPDASLTAGEYWLEHTLSGGGSCSSVRTETFTAYDLSVVASLQGSESECEVILATPSGGSGNYSYVYKKDDAVVGTTVYGPTEDNTYNPDTEGSPNQTPGSINEYHVIVTDTVTGCTATDSIARTACKYTTDLIADRAHGTLTFTANALDTETITLGSKTYTLQTTLTDVDGNIQIGASVADTINNIVAAVNLSGTAGTDYATSMTLNADIIGIANTTDSQAHFYAKVSGSGGESLATTETLTNGSFYNTTLQLIDLDCNSGFPRVSVYNESKCRGLAVAYTVNLVDAGGGGKTFEYNYSIDNDCGQKIQFLPIPSIENATYDTTISATDDTETTTQVVKQLTISC